MTDWDTRFMTLALHIGQWSKDRTTKVGCVIVGPSNEVRSIGYNGFPANVNDQDPTRHERPAKYAWTEHAERNAIYSAARIGVSVGGCRMYLPWFPCMDCARGIVQSGLRELVAYKPDLNHPKWGEDFKSAITLFQEAGVTVRYVTEIPEARSGELQAYA